MLWRRNTYIRWQYNLQSNAITCVSLSIRVYSTDYEMKETNKKKSGRMLLISLSYPSGNLSRKGLVLAGRVPHGEQDAARELWSLRARLWSVHVGSYEEHRVRGTPAALGGRLPHPGAVTAGD